MKKKIKIATSIEDSGKSVMASQRAARSIGIGHSKYSSDFKKQSTKMKNDMKKHENKRNSILKKIGK